MKSINTFFLKISFLIILFSVSTKVLSEAKDVVSKTTDVIKNKLFPAFYENLMKDIATIYSITKRASTDHKASIENKIADFKDGQFLLRLFGHCEIISKERQIKLLSFVLYNAFIIFSNEEKREDMLKNDSLQGILMICAMTGISVRAFDNVKQIVSLIAKECEGLKNNSLDDLTYQQTVYEILQNVARLVVEKDVFSSFAEQISLLEKESLLKEMNTGMTKKFKKTK